MSARSCGSRRSAVLVLCAALLAACGIGGPDRPAGAPGTGSVAASSSAAPASAPSSPVPAHRTPSGAAALGRLEANGPPRVIPVPASVAEKQSHLVGKVDGEKVLLDAGPQTQARPLVLVLHGLGQNASIIRKQTGFSALGALKGFDVAYPDGHRDPATSTTAVTSGAASVTWISSTGDLSTPKPAVTQGAPTTKPPKPSPSTVSPSPSGPVTPANSAPATPSLPPPATHAQTPTPSATPNTGIRSWSAGSCCSIHPRDDVAYLVHVVQAIEKARWIDTRRVYVVGFSNGGMMALDAVCAAPTVFAAAGSVSGPFLGKSCARPIWRHLAAQEDLIVPSQGGIPPGIPGLGIPVDWCGCAFPATSTEQQRFGPFASVLVAPKSAHTWPTPDNPSWRYDAENDLWNYVSQVRL
jgi:pimeloyl-ACP methyl ester carboxylesterase